MKKFLILVKHSLPEIVEGLPANHWKLSREGQALSHRLAERLNYSQPEVIVSSNEPKAKETAEIIARKQQLELHIVDDLHEHDRSNVSYLSQDEFQASIWEFFQKPDVLVFGRETANQAYMRFHANKTVLIVTHGAVISLFISRLTGTSDLLLWNKLSLPTFVVLDLESNTLIERENIV